MPDGFADRELQRREAAARREVDELCGELARWNSGWRGPGALPPRPG